jgi:hypothetical protein
LYTLAGKKILLLMRTRKLIKIKKMKHNLFLLSIIAIFAVISCAPAKNESKQTQPQSLNQTQIMRLKQDASAVSSTGTPAVTAPAQGNSTVKLNPPHGQPGHICEIPVGSPLPTTPAIAATNNISNTVAAPSANLNSAAAAPAASSNVRLNPPHGQPGHICEIPVGSPLP